jgi:hypothetical protein
VDGEPFAEKIAREAANYLEAVDLFRAECPTKTEPGLRGLPVASSGGPTWRSEADELDDGYRAAA